MVFFTFETYESFNCLRLYIWYLKWSIVIYYEMKYSKFFEKKVFIFPENYIFKVTQVILSDYKWL